MLPLSTISTGFLLAFRARLSWLACGSLVAVIFAALLSAQFSGRQPATVALDSGLSFIRLLLPLILALTTQELLSREFDRRYYLNTLPYPYPRHKFLLGRFISILAIMLGVLSLLTGALALLVWQIDQDYAQTTPVALDVHYLVTAAFIGIDMMVLTSVATLLATASSTPSFVFIGTFGFMLVARSFGAIVELLTHNATVVADTASYRSGIGLLSYLLPDLGALDVRMVALYGKMELLPADWPWLVLSSLIYTVGLLCLAVWALNRKRFA